MKTSLGDYNILKKLGEGGLGEVYLAEHKFLKKRYALKVIYQEFSLNETFIEQFEKDIGVLATLDHPSVIKLHNISHTDKHYFLVMDLMVDSEDTPKTLDRFLKFKTHFSEKEVETVLRQIASALDYAHSIPFDDSFLVHKSLKFTNIFIDDNYRVFLSDFALSRIMGEGKLLLSFFKKMLKESTLKEEKFEDFKILDMSNSFLNSYLFLAPEQKRIEKIDQLDSRIDSFSFGVLTYFLITRQFPEGYFELPSKIAPEYRLNWDLLICKCLQRDSSKRPIHLVEAMNNFLTQDRSDLSNMDVVSWEEVGKKVENAMQMSFEFSFEKGKDLERTNKNYNDTGFIKSSEQPKPVIRPPEIVRPKYESDPGTIFQKELNVSYYTPKQVEIKEVEPIQTKMIIIPAGLYWRGSKDGAIDEKPQHKIALSSFAVDIHPVSNEQFVRFLEAMGGEKDSNNNDIIRLRSSRIKRSGGKLIIEAGYAKHPVVGVTWYGALAYAKWVGKRLPTEGEWEIAATGGLEEAYYPTGANIDHSLANFFNSDTTAVMSYPPNGYGLYDMAGNVYEWCHDWYAYNYYDTSLQEPKDPRGPQQGVYRVLRGGCWKSLPEDMRCAHRHRNNPGAINATYGFRCAADVS